MGHGSKKMPSALMFPLWCPRFVNTEKHPSPMLDQHPKNNGSNTYLCCDKGTYFIKGKVGHGSESCGNNTYCCSCGGGGGFQHPTQKVIVLINSKIYK